MAKDLNPREDEHLQHRSAHPDDDEPFVTRHIGASPDDVEYMLKVIGCSSLADFTDKVVPSHIRLKTELDLPPAMTEYQALHELRTIAFDNHICKSLIGQGFYNTITPTVLLRNVFENPGWYTAYTPYQPEISQGRLEALLNFQTMIVELTGMDVANASLLDEASAAAEAMLLMHRVHKGKKHKLLLADNLFATTKSVLQTRAAPLNIEIVELDVQRDLPDYDCSEAFGLIVQYPGQDGDVFSLADVTALTQKKDLLCAVGTDLMALCLLEPPGKYNVDICYGSAQRFGVPLGFGGPHAAFFAVKDEYKRQLPGRLIGVSVDSEGQPAYRMALQTREQHIRRDKATSNICTAQALLANMAAFYAIYHGQAGLLRIAKRIHRMTRQLYHGLKNANYQVNEVFFDTLTVTLPYRAEIWHQRARDRGINLRYVDENRLGVSLDECVYQHDIEILAEIFELQDIPHWDDELPEGGGIPTALQRTDTLFTSDVFHKHRSETSMMRYLRFLKDKDITLDHSMIPLGSCTMKLNSSSEMIPLSWKHFSDTHPLAPQDQTQGYRQMIDTLERDLCAITGFDAISFQPNSGAQGEYSGLMAIRGYLHSKDEKQRDICLIPVSAHGTNAASAALAGMQVVTIACEDNGDICREDLQKKAEQYRDRLAAFMVTYPSTHGVFESGIEDLCAIIHECGGLVYMDGANMNAQLGLCRPADMGADVAHLNLHKTFCIPHGGGGPGVGPVCVKKHLADFLPGHITLDRKEGAVSAAPFGSALILPISYMFIRLMGGDGLTYSAQIAMLAANYIAFRLKDCYPTLYRGQNGMVAHECILDVRHLKDDSDVVAEDIAKRLMDYGFHAPTMSFPVPNTLMVEPTESESLTEIERFITAMRHIYQEIQEISAGTYNKSDNLLKQAPFTAESLVGEWDYPFSRAQAVFPISGMQGYKYWPSVRRIDNVYGDRNLFCTCPPLEIVRENSDA